MTYKEAHNHIQTTIWGSEEKALQASRIFNTVTIPEKMIYEGLNAENREKEFPEWEDEMNPNDYAYMVEYYKNKQFYKVEF